MNLQEAIRARRAVRAFDHLPVKTEIIHTLLEAAIQAPSAMNAQPWAFAIVQDRERLQRYSDDAKRLITQQTRADAKTRQYSALLRNQSFNVFYDAGTLIVICVAQRGPYSEADAWLAAENLMLTACDLGLGTCCVGFAVPLLNTPEVKAELAIPESAVVIAPIIVGYPRAQTPAPPRAAPRIFSWLRDPAHPR
jgi:nitroreductase